MEEISRLFLEEDESSSEEEDEGSETDQLDYNKIKITPHYSIALTPMN